MEKTRTKNHKRINITLPRDTVHLIDRVADKGTRSHFINQAIHFYVSSQSRQNLCNQLKKGALGRSERDLQLAEDWFNVEHDS